MTPTLFHAPRFRKRPVVIEAVQFTDVRSLKFIEAWSDGKVRYDDESGVYCETLEGPLHVSDNDWVIRGIQGEFYPCKPDIFQATYEAVEEAEPTGDPNVCANCGHSRSLHFKPDAYVPGKCDYQYDLCGCRDFKPGGVPQ